MFVQRIESKADCKSLRRTPWKNGYYGDSSNNNYRTGSGKRRGEQTNPLARGVPGHLQARGTGCADRCIRGKDTSSKHQTFGYEIISTHLCTYTYVLLQLAQGSDRGDNYTAALYRIKLSGKRRSLKWEQNVICKVMPESVVAREAYKSDKLFR